MTETSDTGALSFDQAVESLIPKQEETPAEAPVEAIAEPEPEGETSAPEEAVEEAENPETEEETEAPTEPVVAAEPPKYWSQEAKAKFAELPPELQAVVLEQEGPREAAAAKAKQEAQEVRQKAERDIQQVQTLAEALNERIPQWQQAFESKWGNPDWAEYARQYGAEQMVIAKAEFDAEQAQLAEATKAREIVQRQAQMAFVQAEFAKLAEIEPDLAPDLKDPAKGAEKRVEVVNYLKGLGIGDEQLTHISAVEMSIARKAMAWDNAQKSLQAPPKKPAAPPPKAAARPAAAPAQSPQQRSAQQIANRFAQTKSVEDAVALLLAKKA